MKKYYTPTFLIVFIIPIIVSASWWNPFTWFKKPVSPSTPIIQEVIVPTEPPLLPVEEKIEVKKSVTKKPPVKKEVTKPIVKTNTPEEIADLIGVFNKVIHSLDISHDNILKNIAVVETYPNDLYNTVYTSQKLKALDYDVINYKNKVIGYRDEVLRTQTIDSNYWKTVGLPEMALAKNLFIETSNDIIDSFQNSGKSYSYSTPSVPSGCYTADEDIRREIGGGLATESQVQAMVAKRKKDLGCAGLIPMAVCKDGWISYSANRAGTCSDHGGVMSWY